MLNIRNNTFKVKYIGNYVSTLKINSIYDAYNILNHHGEIFDIIKVITNDRSHIPCSIEEFILYLEKNFLPEMNWENHGDIWEIDHILPCSSFDFTQEGDLEKCFHYSNHQPLFKTTEIAESFGYTDQIGNRNKGKKLL